VRGAAVGAAAREEGAKALILAPTDQDRDPQRWGRRAWRRAEQSKMIVHLYFAKESPPAPGPWRQGSSDQDCADQPAQPVITGAGLDPSCAPAGIPSNGSDGEGCWGGGTAAGTQADVGVVVVRVVAVPVGGAAVVRVVDPRATAQQLGDPPSPLSLEALGQVGHGQSHGGQTAGA